MNRTRTLPRRLPSLALLGLLALALALQLNAASAGVTWCRTDPVVLLDGVVADVWVASAAEAYLQATGPTVVVLTVPRGTRTEHVLSDAGFGHGYDVRFAESAELRRTEAGLEVEVAVYVPMRTALPVLVEFVPRVVGVLAPASAEGKANAWVALRTTL